jgi:hypothetical protein
MKSGPERTAAELRQTCRHIWHFYFSSKYQLLSLDPHGSRFPSPRGQIAETRRERRGEGRLLGGRQGKLHGHFCCRWCEEEHGGATTFQDSCNPPPARLSVAGTGSKTTGTGSKTTGNKSESSSPSMSQLSRPGLGEACPQMQSYSNSGMGFARIKGIEMSVAVMTRCCVGVADRGEVIS